MHKNDLSKKTAVIMNGILDQPQFEKNKIQVGIKEILLKKRKRNNSNSDYFQTLVRNITFLEESSQMLNSVLLVLLKQQSFLSIQEFNYQVSSMMEKINSKENLKEKIPIYQKEIEGNTMQNKIETAELFYGLTYLKKEIILTYILIFLDPQNRKFMKNYYLYNPKHVVNEVNKYAQNFSSMLLDNISFNI